VEGESKGNQYRNNLFFGEHPGSEPADPRKSIADPLLADPGGAGDGLASAVAAYSLRRRSPAIFAGRVIARNVDRDFAGRRVLRMDGRVDLGALTWKPDFKGEE
jgi:hypothetical protein